MKSLFAKTDKSVSLILSFLKKIMFFVVMIYLAIFLSYILPNQNNPTATASLIEINWKAQ